MKPYWASLLLTSALISAFIFWSDPACRWHHRLHFARPLKPGEVLLWKSTNVDEQGLRLEQIHDNETAELVAMGSSRVVLMDSAMFSSAFYNAGAGGSGLEFFAELWEVLKTFKEPPRHLIIFIDPWTFGPLQPTADNNASYWAIQHGRFSFLRTINLRMHSFFYEFKDLFTFSMAMESFRQLVLKRIQNGDSDLIKLENQLKPGDIAIRSDGSIHFGGTIGRAIPWTAPQRPGRDAAHRFLTEWNFEESSFNLFQGLLQEMRQKGTQVMLVVPPFSPEGYQWMKTQPALENVMNQENQALAKLSFPDQSIVYCHRLDPSALACQNTEFFDELHMKRSCVEKLVSSCFSDFSPWTPLLSHPPSSPR